MDEKEKVDKTTAVGPYNAAFTYDEVMLNVLRCQLTH